MPGSATQSGPRNVVWMTFIYVSFALFCYRAHAQETPNQPTSQPATSQRETPGASFLARPLRENWGQQTEKHESSNPAQRTREATIYAAEATRKMAEKALVKARDWESSWLTGVYVPEGQRLTPLTAIQRRELYLQETLATPGAYMKRMFAAAIDQARGSPSQWQGGWGGYGERFASREGQFISENSLTALGNAALRYEPRYDQCQCSGFWPRTRHAIIRNFLTYNETESELRPQWALYGGAFGGGLISTAWKPRPRNAFAEGGRAMLSQAAYGTLLNFFIEFSRDINRKIGSKR